MLRGETQTTQKRLWKKPDENTQMKKSLTKIFLILALLIASSSLAFTQTQDSTTAPSPTPQISETVKTDETISFLLVQNENARDLITAQEKRIADLETENALEKESSASIQKSYESAQSEIASLKQSNAALARAVSINENTIALLQADNAKQKQKAKKATKDKWIAYLVTGGVIALKFLF